MKWFLRVTLLLLLLCLYGQAARSATTVVHVAGWTATSDRIVKIWVVISSLDGRERYTGSGRDVKIEVPTGKYMLQVESPGFETARQVFLAYGPEVFRSIGLSAALRHGESSPTVNGSVRNYDGELRNIRVRLMGLYGDELRESTVNERGSFGFPIDMGAYLLLVVADTEGGLVILDSRPLRVLWNDESIEIDLKDKRGTPVPEAAPKRDRIH